MVDKDNKAAKFAKIMFKTVIVVLILAAGVGVGYYLMATKPVAKKKPAEPLPTRVETVTARAANNDVLLKAMGEVKAAVEVELSAEVAGRIDYVSDRFTPGGKLKKDDVILKIDSRDYELAVKQTSEELAKAKASMLLEQAKRDVAKREYELLGETISKEDEKFVMREPQLLQAKADIEILQARLDEAKLQLERTVIKAPFNAVVSQRYVNVGSSVNAGGRLLSIYGTDEYWVEMSLPLDELKWIDIPRNRRKGSAVKVFIPGTGGEAYRAGYVKLLRSEIEPQGRMARVIAAVQEPLSRRNGDNTPPLLSGSFVETHIKGNTLNESFKFTRQAIRDRGFIWICADNKLEIRKVSPVYKDENSFYLTEGIEEGEKVIVSDIATPVENMLLKCSDE